mgnify:CR=1 FL=1
MTAPTVFLVDDDAAVRDSVSMLLDTAGYRVETFESGEAFLGSGRLDDPGCVILDLRMDGMSGLDVQAALGAEGSKLPVIFLTGHGDIPTTVRAIQAGALDFLTKPVQDDRLIERIENAFEDNRDALARRHAEDEERTRLSGLSARELEVLRLALAGQANKEIARTLGISHRTVEFHRSRILAKTGATNLLQLAHLTTAAS